MTKQQVLVIHQDVYGNELESAFDGYFEVNFGGCLVISNTYQGPPKAVFAKPFWIGAKYLEV